MDLEEQKNTRRAGGSWRCLSSRTSRPTAVGEHPILADRPARARVPSTMNVVCLTALLLAQPPYLYRIASEADFWQVGQRDDSRPDITASTKFLAPAGSDPSLLPVVFQNVNLYPFHIDFMRTEFPDRFPDLSPPEYRRLVEQRATRRYFAGALLRLQPAPREVLWGFDFYTDPLFASELPRRDEVEWVFQQLAAAFDLGPLAFAPMRSDVMALARTWEGTPFSIYIPEGGLLGDFAAYTTGVAYGRLRVFALRELLEASEAGELSWQDLVAVDEAPPDLTSPVAAVLTGSPQAELSHLSLRLAQRGTPNAYFAGITDELRPRAGQLLRLEVSAGGLAVREVTDPAEAEAFWATHRPRLPRLPEVDLGETRLLGLDEIALDAGAASRFGAKASNLALLRAVLPPEHTVDGFAIPFAWYARFMNENTIPHPVDGSPVSYARYLELLEADEAFRTDPPRRTRLLEAFVEYAEDHGSVPGSLATAAAVRVLEVLGTTTAPVRCRSSASFEDVIPFNGAGLYESTSACAADTLDPDGRGPSRCDPARSSERTIERGLRRVWTSLWLPRAYNEREFWQAAHEHAAMGVLVTPAFRDELANGVVLTGNPSRPGDDRYVINVQLGEVDVVSPPPGVLPEKILVEVASGTVVDVRRVRGSTLLPEGEWILTEEEATRLAELSAHAAAELGPRFPQDGSDILLDLEFKFVARDAGRDVVFKQVRPFLRPRAVTEGTLAISVGAGTTACGVFQAFRSLEDEYSLLSVATFLPGRLELPARPGTTTGDLFSSILVGPSRTPAIPRGPGLFRVEAVPAAAGTRYRCSFAQGFLVEATPLEVEVELPVFVLEAAGRPGSRVAELLVDEAFLSLHLDMRAALGEGEDRDTITYASCDYSFLPAFETRVTAESGATARLLSRHVPALQLVGPENLVRAVVDLGVDGRRTQSDYWGLVYSALHHNWDRSYWVFLEPPVGAAHVAELREPTRFTREPARFRLLDQEFRLLEDLAVASWERGPIRDEERPDFLRGDADANGRVEIADAVRMLRWLFLAAEAAPCADAGDADDDGRLTVSDAVSILLERFRGRQLPHPGVLRCGKDLTEDLLPPCDYDVRGCPG